VRLIHGEGNVFKGAGVSVAPGISSYMELSQVGWASCCCDFDGGGSDCDCGCRLRNAVSTTVQRRCFDVTKPSQSGIAAAEVGKKQQAHAAEAGAAAVSRDSIIAVSRDSIMDECQKKLLKDASAAGASVACRCCVIE
jgi:hypothetical protein